MTTKLLARSILIVAAAFVSAACTTMQTLYFSTGYVQFAKADDPSLIPYHGTPRFAEVDDMSKKADSMYSAGYAMLGYSQFVSPLYVSLAQSYSTKYARTLGAEYVVLQTPRQGTSNLHYFLATYWSRVRPEQYTFGAAFEDLPDDVLKRLGKDLNVVMLDDVVPGTPAHAAGLQANDVILAFNGVRVQSADQLSRLIHKHRGEPVDLSVSRRGKEIDTTATLAEPTVTLSAATSYRSRPWRETRPTDWSAFSAASLARMNVEVQREMAQQREIAYQRQQLASQRYLNSLQSERISDLESGRGAVSRRGAISRRGLQMPSRSQQARDYRKFVEGFRRTWNSSEFQGELARQQKLDIWFNNCPNIYAEIFTFPVPEPE